jgi:4-amino-4-deoxy-L-arabinose transferase-like glycosyltransferase
MLGYFPKYYTDKAMLVYFALLICVPVLFGYPMEWYFWIFGIIEVVGFFYFANILPQKWAHYSSKAFTKELFKTALVIRVIYVVFSYWFYDLMTGQPFEFGAADVLFYHESAINGHLLLSEGEFNLIKFYTEQGIDLSDTGYPIYLSLVYCIFDDSILITRIVKALWSAWTCILIYKLSSRNFGENIGRMSAIFCLLMPNLIYYCGSHLKETEMVFLIVLFVERADYAMHSKKIDWKALITALLTACLLFMFRTALAAVAMISLATTLMLSSRNVLSLSKKIAIGAFVVLAMFATVGNQLMREAEELLAKSENAQERSMEWRSNREGGNKFAKYAGAAVFAPMIFTIPFPTMVQTPTQEQQRMIHGGNYIKNITSLFTIFALFILLIDMRWRKHVLIFAITCGYLIVMALSEFAQSERFHLPALPFSLILAAYGVSQLQNKHKKRYNYWLVFIFVANIAWAWFKLKGRGLV